MTPRQQHDTATPFQLAGILLASSTVVGLFWSIICIMVSA